MARSLVANRNAGRYRSIMGAGNGWVRSAVCAVIASTWMLSAAAQASLPYDCHTWVAVLGHQTELAELRARPAPTSPEEERARALEERSLRRKIAELLYAVTEHPLPSSEAANAERVPDWQPDRRPWPLLVHADLQERIQRRLVDKYRVGSPEPLLDAVIMRINLSKQLRATSSPVGAALTKAGLTDPRERLLVAELLSQYNPKSLVRIEAEAKAFERLVKLLRMKPATVLKAYRDSNFGAKITTWVEQDTVGVIELLAQIRLNRHAEDIYRDLVKLHAGAVGAPAKTFLQLLNTFLQLTDPLAEVVDLYSAHRFAAGL